MPIKPAVANPHTFQQQLANFNVAQLALGAHSQQWQVAWQVELAYRFAENKCLESLRTQVAPMMWGHGKGSNHFVAWFESLSYIGPGQQHPLLDWLAQYATLPQMRWFLAQETACEAGFGNLPTYIGVKPLAPAKLDCAGHYRDEMASRKQIPVYGELLDRMLHELSLQPATTATIWESLALSNIMTGIFTTRRYIYHAIGALGVMELSAPQRLRKISAGMQRLGLASCMREYSDLLPSSRISHAQCWIREVLRSLIDENPACAKFIAEGALMRMLCNEHCFNRYSIELLPDSSDYPT
jgi:Iron-containing redox enzyme